MDKFYSQNGEEKIINKYLNKNPDIEKGIYVDIGACHTKLISNTYYYYERGWRGLAVDSYPTVVQTFKKERPRDTFVSVAITDYDGKCIMYGRAIEKSMVGERYQKTYGNSEKFEFPCLTMNTLIKNHPEFSEPDFMSMDIETNEDKALSKCDFNIFRPRIICIEFPGEGIDHRTRWEKYLIPFYDFKEICVINAFYLRKG